MSATKRPARKAPTSKTQNEASAVRLADVGQNMEQPASLPPLVFISYSWDSQAHKDWVKRLATRLRNDGIEVVLDVWGLKLGGRSPEFMEKGIQKSERVLVVCTPKYKRRSDSRRGGAGYEGHIITAAILSGAGKEKFIPILREGSRAKSTPTWLGGVVGVDLRGDEYEDGYRQLVTTLHKQYEPIPPVGRPPDYVLQGRPTGAASAADGPAVSSRPRRQRSSNTASSGGPEIVFDYVYAENDKDHHDANRPLTLRNLSNVSPAYNVEVLPLSTEHGTTEFEPHLIPYIEPTGTRNVFVNIKDGSPLFGNRRLPEFLFRSYADTSVEELFGTKTFPLRVRYNGTDTPVFETQSELLFRPWKKQTRIGRTVRSIASSVIQPRPPEVEPKSRVRSTEATAHRQWDVHETQASSLAPILSYEGITSGGDQSFDGSLLNLQVANIRNSQIAARNTARDVRACVEYRHAAGTCVRVESALWIKEQTRSHVVSIAGNDVFALTILMQAKDGTLRTSLDESGTRHELDVGHWEIRITITGQNCEALLLEGGFTLLPDGNRLAYDHPALRAT